MRNRTLKEIQEDIRTLTRVPSEFIHAKLDELAKEIEELVDKQWIHAVKIYQKRESAF